MTEPSGLTPEQDAVRRLLADARHDGSTPPQVVARLDETLASLVAERDGAPLPGDGPTPAAPVVDLGARRRRTVGLALLAAAAVVVAGVAVGQGLPRMSGGQSDSAASGGADTATSQDRELADGSDSGAGSAEQSPEALRGTSVAPKASYPTLSSTDPGLDDELLDLRATTSAAAAEPGPARTLADCDLQGIGRGRRVAAQVDGSSGVVVFRRPDGATQQVELYLCGTPAPVRMLTLPAP